MNTITFPGINLSLNIKKIAFTIGNIQIHTYAICIVVAILVAFVLLKKSKKNYNIDFDWEKSQKKRIEKDDKSFNELINNMQEAVNKHIKENTPKDTTAVIKSIDEKIYDKMHINKGKIPKQLKIEKHKELGKKWI